MAESRTLFYGTHDSRLRQKRILRRGFPREIRRGWTIHHRYVPNHGSVAYAWFVTRRTARYLYVVPDRAHG